MQPNANPGIEPLRTQGKEPDAAETARISGRALRGPPRRVGDVRGPGRSACPRRGRAAGERAHRPHDPRGEGRPAQPCLEWRLLPPGGRARRLGRGAHQLQQRPGRRRRPEARPRVAARIPLLFGLDVLHGFRTTFPMPPAETATFNLALARRAAEWSAREAAHVGVQWDLRLDGGRVARSALPHRRRRGRGPARAGLHGGARRGLPQGRARHRREAFRRLRRRGGGTRLRCDRHPAGRAARCVPAASSAPLSRPAAIP